MLQGQTPRRPLRLTGSLTLAAALAAVPAAAQTGAPAGDQGEATRVTPWTGGERLAVSVAADVRYVPGGRTQVTLTGPRQELDRIEVDGGWIRYRPETWMWWRWGGWGRRHPRVHIVVTAPHLSSASLSGSGSLDLGRLSQDRLDLSISGSGRASAGGAIRALNISLSGSGGAKLDGVNASAMRVAVTGSGWVDASGACESLRLWLTGSGRADMGGLKLQDAEASLTGSGMAKIAPRREARLRVTGSGVVMLATQPASLHTSRFGSGRVIGPNES